MLLYSSVRHAETIVGSASATASSATTASANATEESTAPCQNATEAEETEHEHDGDLQLSDEEPVQESRAAFARARKADVASFFAKVRLVKTIVPSADATDEEKERLRVCLQSIKELPADMRIALKRGDAHMSVSDAVAQRVEQPAKQPTAASPKPQPRRPGLTLRRWPGKTEKS